ITPDPHISRFHCRMKHSNALHSLWLLRARRNRPSLEDSSGEQRDELPPSHASLPARATPVRRQSLALFHGAVRSFEGPLWVKSAILSIGGSVAVFTNEQTMSQPSPTSLSGQQRKSRFARSITHARATGPERKRDTASVWKSCFAQTVNI